MSDMVFALALFLVVGASLAIGLAIAILMEKF
jgi:hypothetical protein